MMFLRCIMDSMSWILLALCAPVFDTIVNFIDKYLVGEKVKDYRAMPIFMGIVGTCAGIILFGLRGFPLFALTDMILILTAGILTYFSIYFYFKTLDFEETSIVVLLFQASPIITLVLSSVFLRETISFQQFLGFILVLSASTAISLDTSSKGAFKLNRSFYYIMASNIFWSSGAILFKYTAPSNDFVSTLGLEGIGIGIGALMAYLCHANLRKAFQDTLQKVSRPVLGLLTLNEILSLTGKWLVFWAVLLGPVALVDVVVSVQVFYAIAAGWVLTYLFPQIFKEDLSKSTLLLKIASAITLMVGVFLIAHI